MAFSEKKYKIEDFFNRSSLLSSTTIVNQKTYPGCKLKSVEAIIKDGRLGDKRKRTEGTDAAEEMEKTKKMKKTESTKVRGRGAKRARK
jgi:hypothetical protein